MDEPSPTFGEYLREWLAIQRTQLQTSSWEGYAANLRRYTLPHLGDIPIGELTAARLNRFYVDLLDHGGHRGRPLALGTVRRAHAIIHKALADARRLDVVDRNVADDAMLPRFDPRHPDGGRNELRVWNAEQLRTFLAATAGQPLHELWFLAAGTGMRRGELLGLQWEDVDLHRRLIQVRHSLSDVYGHPLRLKSPKNGRTRALTIDERVTELLTRLKIRTDSGVRTSEGWDLVFKASDGSALKPSRISRRFLDVVQRVPVPRIRLHDLRHSHATLLLSQGVPVKVVAERLGHSTIRLTLDTYAHVLPTMDADAVERFAAHVWGSLNGEARSPHPSASSRPGEAD